MSTNHAPGPEVTRVDRDHYPAWINENPALFAKSVREFLAEHPAEQWECRLSMFGYRIRLTAVAKASAPTLPLWHEAELRLGPQEVVFRFGTEADASRFYAARAAIAKATGQS